MKILRHVYRPTVIFVLAVLIVVESLHTKLPPRDDCHVHIEYGFPEYDSQFGITAGTAVFYPYGITRPIFFGVA